MTDKRHFGRIPFGTTVELEVANTIVNGTLEDISLRGALIKAEGELPSVGTFCEMTLALAEGVMLQFVSEVVHHKGVSEIGIRFTEQDPVTFGHLIRLLELNTGDAEQIERELDFLMGYEDSESK